MKRIEKNGFYINAPTKFNIVGAITFEIDGTGIDVKTLMMIGLTIGLFNFILVGAVAIWGFNILFPSMAVEQSIVNIIAVNLIRIAFLKIEKDD